MLLVFSPVCADAELTMNAAALSAAYASTRIFTKEPPSDPRPPYHRKKIEPVIVRSLLRQSVAGMLRLLGGSLVLGWLYKNFCRNAERLMKPSDHGTREIAFAIEHLCHSRSGADEGSQILSGQAPLFQPKFYFFHGVRRVPL